MTEIFKVQVPLSTNVIDAPALVYNEDRSLMMDIPITHNVVLAMGDRTKAFFFGHVNGEYFIFENEAPWQEW